MTCSSSDDRTALDATKLTFEFILHQTIFFTTSTQRPICVAHPHRLENFTLNLTHRPHRSKHLATHLSVISILFIATLTVFTFTHTSIVITEPHCQALFASSHLSSFFPLSPCPTHLILLTLFCFAQCDVIVSFSLYFFFFNCSCCTLFHPRHPFL